MAQHLDEMFNLLPATVEEARNLSTEELRTILTNAPVAIARMLTIYAAIWKVLDERKEDLKEFIRSDNDIYKWVRRIANGETAAETVCAFGTDNEVVRAVAKLPVDEQKRLVANPVVEVVIDATSGDTVKRQIQELNKHQLEQVLDTKAGRTRTPEAQAVFMRPFTTPPAPLKKGREIKRGRFIANTLTRRIRIDGPDGDESDAVALLRALGYTVEKE